MCLGAISLARTGAKFWTDRTFHDALNLFPQLYHQLHQSSPLWLLRVIPTTKQRMHYAPWLTSSGIFGRRSHVAYQP
jgi:hypothetical protein